MNNKGFSLLLILLVSPVVVILFSLMFIIYWQIGTPVRIMGNSMVPNYVNGEFYLTKKRTENSKYLRGNTIIYKSPEDQNITYIKRIIAISGDTLKIEDGQVWLNGVKLNEKHYVVNTYTAIPKNGAFLEGEILKVPKNHYFVLGDNRAISKDSRSYGFIPLENIEGKVWFCYFNCK